MKLKFRPMGPSEDTLHGACGFPVTRFSVTNLTEYVYEISDDATPQQVQDLKDNLLYPHGIEFVEIVP